MIRGEYTLITLEYVRKQLKEDLEYEHMSLKEYIDMFTGKLVEKGK